MDTEKKVLFSRSNTALKLNISLRTLDHLVRIKEIQPIKVGRRVMFSELSILRFAGKDHPTK